MTTAPAPIRVLIAEDHELARRGLALTLDDEARIEVIAQAQDGLQAVALSQAHRPDIILMDLGMPNMDGICATQRIKADQPGIKIVILTSHQDEEEVLASLAAGADAYCMKDIRIDRLCQVLEMVMDGAIWFDPAVAAIVMQSLPGPHPVAQTLPPHPKRRQYNTRLTERELEVLGLIVAGKSNREIADTLNVSTNTAKAHVSNIIQKLAVDDRTQVAVKALQEGLISR